MSAAEQREWMTSGIGRPPMFQWLAEHRDDFDFFVFLPYLFNTTVLGIEAVKDKAIAIPCLHDEGPAYTQVVREALESARGIFFNAPGERDFALDTLRIANPNCFTLGMGMDLDRRGDARAFAAKHGIEGEYLVYCGRLEEGKNVPWLIECFTRYKARHPGPLKLVLIGNGDAPKHPDVVALGFLPEQEKHDALAGAVALVNPSVNESFSIVLMESWIQRRPVLVHARCAVTADHVARSGGGLTFEDDAGFEAAVRALVTQPAQATRMGADGYRYVEETYSWPVLLKRFEACLNLLRTASAYEDLAVKGIARARHFAHHRYAERWRAFLDHARAQSPAGTAAER
ncbi:Glycosyl transferases group 1 [compost metagenome]